MRGIRDSHKMYGGKICIFVKEIRTPLPLVWENQCTVSSRRGAVGEEMGDKRQPHNVWGDVYIC